MSRSPSPASSLDFVSSDGGSSSGSDYGGSRRRQPKKAAGRPPPQQRKKITLKLNVGGVRASRDAVAAHQAMAEDEYDDEEDGTEGLQINRRADLSRQGLKDDHDLRPLWVDEYGNMQVVSSHSGSPC